MSDNTIPDKQASADAAFEGGVAASHAPVSTLPALVGPTTADEFNTLRAALVPVACFRLEDVRFAFDSSFVLPDAAQELDGLAALIALHTDTTLPPARRHPPLSVFGHADAAGSDDYNKVLSGRRGEAIYGLLARKTEIWERLFSQPFHGDAWGNKSLQIMLDALLFDPGRQDGTMDGASQNALKAFQQANGLAPDGKAGAQTRQKLFLAYMDALCRKDVANAGGQPFVVTPAQFLGEGADGGHKGDVQGCGEFNPVQVLSQSEEERFAADKDKTERNVANAPNRRVLIFLFRPGTQIEPAKWPCPRAEEGPGGCRKRFWSDADKRRAPGTERREFDKTQDTFACRFYHRLADTSPCERILESVTIRLYNGFGQAIPLAPFVVAFGSKPFSKPATADDQGVITLRDVSVPTVCRIKWGFVPDKDAAPELLFERTIFLDARDATSDAAAAKKLSNLGYDLDQQTVNINGFQLDYGFLVDPPLEITGLLDDRTKTLLDKVYRQSADDLRRTNAG